MEHIVNNCIELFKQIDALELPEKVDCINKIRKELHNYSPFKNEPVDCVQWIKSDSVVANDYNPNKVAPPEMELLKISIENDGYTQPIVSWNKEDNFEVVDGFHRNRVGKEYPTITERIKGYLPLVIINKNRIDKSDRIASTIRHNRARGKHTIDAMSEIIIELKNRNWRNARIAKELGMDEDEILRLCQITGLESLFKDEDFSKAWLVEDSVEDDFQELEGFVTQEEKEQHNFRTTNTSDDNRVFHTFDKWECYKAGFYNTTPPEDMKKDQCELEYARFLSNDDEFRGALNHIITEWKHSCEHYLTNKSMNRVAWLGQASLCYAKKIPSTFRGGFYLLTPEQQNIANNTACEYLNKWLKNNGYEEVTFEEAMSIGRQVDIY